MSAHHHQHGTGQGHATRDARRIAIAFTIVFVFMIVEVAGGLLSGSLALLADAGHMVCDAAALAISWAAIHMGRRPADPTRSYGYRRLEVLAAFVNGCALFAIAGWIVFEAAGRLAAPVPVLGGTMLAVAIAGLLANLAAFFVLNSGNRENLNLRSAWLHIVGDILGSAAAIGAAIVIMITGWYPIDPILSVGVVLVILWSAWRIVRDSAHILLEGTPPDIDLDDMRKALKDVLPAEADVHHVHVWSITAGQAIATLHVCGLPQRETDSAIAAIKSRLAAEYGITHSTIQIEQEECADRFSREPAHRHG